MVVVVSAASFTPPCWMSLDDNCLATGKFDGGYSDCFPLTKPDACSDNSWNEVQQCRAQPNSGMDECPPPPSEEYKEITGYENCTDPTEDRFTHEVSVCLRPFKYKTAKCDKETYNALAALAKEDKLKYCPYID